MCARGYEDRSGSSFRGRARKRGEEEEEGEREERRREDDEGKGEGGGRTDRENSIPWSIMQPVCRITAGTRFRFAPMKGLFPAWKCFAPISPSPIKRFGNIIHPFA